MIKATQYGPCRCCCHCYYCALSIFFFTVRLRRCWYQQRPSILDILKYFRIWKLHFQAQHTCGARNDWKFLHNVVYKCNCYTILIELCGTLFLLSNCLEIQFFVGLFVKLIKFVKMFWFLNIIFNIFRLCTTVSVMEILTDAMCQGQLIFSLYSNSIFFKIW